MVGAANVQRFRGCMLLLLPRIALLLVHFLPSFISLTTTIIHRKDSTSIIINNISIAIASTSTAHYNTKSYDHQA